MTINRIAPLSVAKVAATLYAALGLLVGALVSVVAMAGGFTASESEFGPLAILFGVGAIVILPIVYGCLGAIMLTLVAAIYNAVAWFVGGIEVDLS
jgi:hypothetical protein